MKKFFSFLLASALLLVVSLSPDHLSAQIVTPITLSKTSLSNTDTAKALLSVDKTLTSVEVAVAKTSGTVAGSVKLQGTFDNINFDDLNTLTLSDQALNRKVMAIPTPLIYPFYRLIFLSSGSNATTVSAKKLKRSE